jgi:hypothetical protein
MTGLIDNGLPGNKKIDGHLMRRFPLTNIRDNGENAGMKRDLVGWRMIWSKLRCEHESVLFIGERGLLIEELFHKYKEVFDSVKSNEGLCVNNEKSVIFKLVSDGLTE